MHDYWIEYKQMQTCVVHKNRLSINKEYDKNNPTQIITDLLARGSKAPSTMPGILGLMISFLKSETVSMYQTVLDCKYYTTKYWCKQLN